MYFLHAKQPDCHLFYLINADVFFSDEEKC